MTTPMARPSTGASSPKKATATTERRAPWTRMTTTSRSTRPRRSDPRLAGVTRIRSTTPARHSAINPKPAKAAPKMPSWTSSPGTNTCQAEPGGKPGADATGSSSGPNRIR